MYTQTLQHLRSEVEAASTLHLALGRLSQHVDPRAPVAWSGPLLDEIEDAVDEDGSYRREAIAEMRWRMANALATQCHAARARISSLKNGDKLKNILDSTLAVGTGNKAILKSPNPVGILTSMVHSGELRLDFAQRAAFEARVAIEEQEQYKSKRKPATTAPARKKPTRKQSGTKGKKTVAKVKRAVKKEKTPVKKVLSKMKKALSKNRTKVARPKAKRASKRVSR